MISTTNGRMVHAAACGTHCGCASVQCLSKRPARLQQALLVLGVVGKHGANPEGEVAWPHSLQLAHHQRVLARLRVSHSKVAAQAAPSSRGTGHASGLQGRECVCATHGGQPTWMRPRRWFSCSSSRKAPATSAASARTCSPCAKPCQFPVAGRSHATPYITGVAATSVLGLSELYQTPARLMQKI